MAGAVLYPLPYAFARSHQLLLEEQDGTLTLWIHDLASDAAQKFNGQCLTFNGRKTALWSHPKEVHIYNVHALPSHLP